MSSDSFTAPNMFCVGLNLNLILSKKSDSPFFKCIYSGERCSAAMVCYHIVIVFFSLPSHEPEIGHPVQPANVVAHTKMTPDPVLKMGRGCG